MQTNGLPLRMTYIGGPTALLEIGGLRLLTDPAFDPPGGEYPSGSSVLRKLHGPALTPQNLGRIDAVLLSHDHHFDNLDRAGRALLANVGCVFTTVAGANRLQGNAIGLSNWQSADLAARTGLTLRVTGTPARHGPAHLDPGPVTGFLLTLPQSHDHSIYISGDTVWFEGTAEVAHRFPIETAVLFLGAARVGAVGPWPLTMTSEDALAAARAFPQAAIIPLHYEGWAHFSESRSDVVSAFASAGLQNRLRWLEPGISTDITHAA